MQLRGSKSDSMSAPSFESFPDLELDASKHSRIENITDTYRSRSKDKPARRSHKRKDRESKKDGLSLTRPERHRRTEEEYSLFEDGELSKVYRSDRKGDHLNITYGGLHASSVPRYYRFGRGSVLGLSNAFKIVGDRGKGIEVGLLGRRLPRRYTDHHAFTLMATSKVRRLLGSHAPMPEDLDFIPLPGKPEKDTQYRSLLLEEEETSSSASDTEDVLQSSEDDEFMTTLTADQDAIKSLDRALSENPCSPSNWLSLISHTLAAVPQMSKNAAKARSEIALSILTRAISAHPLNAASCPLRLAYLEAGEEIWDSEKLRGEWENALRLVHDAKIPLWLAWLDWRVKFRMSGGRIGGLIEDASRALETLRDSELGRLGILWRMAVFFREAGFSERATALFQALAELTYFVPLDLISSPFDAKLSAFEDYWDSEVPRVGEQDATGWAEWHTGGHIPIATERSAVLSLPQADDTDPYRRWSSVEGQFDRTLSVPHRSVEESEDPFSTILFSDIKPLLFPISTLVGKRFLRLICLSLSGLHVPGLCAAFDAACHSDELLLTCGIWAETHFADTLLDKLFPPNTKPAVDSWDSHVGVILGRQLQPRSGLGPVKEWHLGTFAPLEGLGLHGEGRMWEEHDVQGLDAPFIRHFFEQTRTVVDDDEWTLLGIAFEASTNIKNALRLSKKLLSMSPNALPLWASHARLERVRARNHEARKIYRANLSPDGQHAMRAGEVQLWWDWAEMEWLDGKPNDALVVIHEAAGVRVSGGLGTLRTKKTLDQRIELDPSNKYWICLRALFELLTTLSLTAALNIFDSRLPSFSPREALEVAILRVLYHHTHTLRVPCPPVVMRERVEAAVDRFPSNTIVLGIFLEAQRGQSVWGRVRKLFGENVSNAKLKKKIPRHIWEVWVADWDKGHFDAERVRTCLDRATRHGRTKESPSLWRIFIEFEMRTGNIQRARNLLFRAVGQCPWVKGLYLLAFSHLRSVFSARELNALAESMAERSLRLRQDLDQYLKNWEGSGTDEEQSGYESGDAEHEAKELRRRMPF